MFRIEILVLRQTKMKKKNRKKNEWIRKLL